MIANCFVIVRLRVPENIQKYNRNAMTFYTFLFFFSSQGFISEPHKPETDATASIRLFNMYHGKPSELGRAKSKLQGSRPPQSFAKRNNYRYEGVCMAAFYPAKCFCGAPTKKN